LETTDTSGLESMLESVLRIGSSIRSPAAFARRVLGSTRLDSLLGANKTTHSFTPITTDCLLINVPFGATIKGARQLQDVPFSDQVRTEPLSPLYQDIGRPVARVTLLRALTFDPVELGPT